MKDKINEVIENLNNANFYARGLKPGKAIDIVGATKGSGFFNGEDPTIINTVINNSVLTANKPGLYKIFSTKVVNEEMKSGLTFLFQEQPLNNNCENDKLSWGILKINFVYNPTDADIDYNTYNIKIVDFAFEEERNLTDKLDRFMLVRRINPCNAKNVMELYYRVPTKEEATECADACGPAALFTLLNIDNKEIDFNTYIKLENEGLNSTTYDGINGVITNPVINFDYDDITLIGDTEGYGLMNTRNVKVDPTTTPQLIDSFDTTGDVEMRKVNVLKNHRPYDEEPTTNDIVFNMEVPKLIDKITVKNDGVVEGTGYVVVPEVSGAENNVEITIENTFNEEAIKEKVEQYAPKTDVIPADGSAVVYLAPVSGNDDNDGLSEDTAIKSMTTLLNKGYAKELEVHLVGESPSVEGEGIIVVNGANYSKITIIDEVAILAGYSLEVNNSNVVISTELPATMPYDEILIEEDTVLDYDPATERIHINTYSFAPTMFALTEGEDETEVEEITESYYSVMPLQLTMGNIYSLEANNSIVDITGTFTDILNCKLENTDFYNSIENLNIINNNIIGSNIHLLKNSTVNSGEIHSSVIFGKGGANVSYATLSLINILIIDSIINTINITIVNDTYKSYINNSICSFHSFTHTSTTTNFIEFTSSRIFFGQTVGNSRQKYINLRTSQAFIYGSKPTSAGSIAMNITGSNVVYLGSQSSSSVAGITQIPYTLPTASTSTLGGVKVDGTTITISNGVISSTSGSGGIILGGEAVSVDDTPEGDTINVLYDGDTITLNESNALQAKRYTQGDGIIIEGDDETDNLIVGVNYGEGLKLGTGEVDEEGHWKYPIAVAPATADTIGGVKEGSTVQISPDGTLNINPDNIAFDTRLIPLNTENITYYVDPVNGIDTNDGLTTSTQLKTIEAALNKHGSQNITISLYSSDFTISALMDLFGYKQVILLGSTSFNSEIAELTVKNGTLIIQENNIEIGNLSAENAYISGDLRNLGSLNLIDSTYRTSISTASFNLSSLRLEHSTIQSTSNTFSITAQNPYIINSNVDNISSLTLTKGDYFKIQGLDGSLYGGLNLTGTDRKTDIICDCKICTPYFTASNIGCINCDIADKSLKGDSTFNFGTIFTLANVQIDSSKLTGNQWEIVNTFINGCDIRGCIGTGSNIDNTNKGVGNNMIFNYCHTGKGANWVLSYCNIIGANATYFSGATKSVVNGTYVS